MRLEMLTLPDEDILVQPKALSTLAPEETVILETGRMGEPIKALQKMATSHHRLIHIEQGDLVYLTTSPSHAMETILAKN